MSEFYTRGGRSGFVSAGKSEIHFRIDGAENDQWIVLSNSLGSNLTMWDDQVELLTRKFCVLRYDTRGHGQSSTPAGPYRFSDLCSDVIQLLDHLGIGSAVFMGLSLGGMTGLGLGLECPDRIKKIVCADGRADAPETFRKMWDERIAAVRSGGLQAILDGTINSWFTKEWIDTNPDRVAVIRKMVLSTDPVGYVNCCLALKELNYFKHLPEISVPVLYVGGDQDKGASPEVMKDMAKATPNAKYLSVQNAAHLANINSAADFNRSVSDFLGLA
jgi:3-oxoadipate enol-lactonase